MNRNIYILLIKINKDSKKLYNSNNYNKNSNRKK